jgi:hypothetical protein
MLLLLLYVCFSTSLKKLKLLRLTLPPPSGRLR